MVQAGLAPYQVTMEWLAAVLSGGGYRAIVLSDGRSFDAHHPTYRQVSLDIHAPHIEPGYPPPGVIRVYRRWRIPPSAFSTSEVRAAVARANSSQWRCKFVLDGDGQLFTTTFIHLLASLAPADVLKQLADFDHDLALGLASCGLDRVLV